MDNGGMPKDWTPYGDSWVDRGAKIAELKKEKEALEKQNAELKEQVESQLESLRGHMKENGEVIKTLVEALTNCKKEAQDGGTTIHKLMDVIEEACQSLPAEEVETKTTSLFCDECGKEEKVEIPCDQSVTCNLMICKDCQAEGKEECIMPTMDYHGEPYDQTKPIKEEG